MADARVSVAGPTVVARRPVAVAKAPAAVVARPMTAARSIQQRMGNRGAQAVARQVLARASGPAGGSLAAAIKPNLTISQPGDPYEQEADRVADAVMSVSTPAQAVSRKSAGQQSGSSIVISRRCASCEHAQEHATSQSEEMSLKQVPVQRQESSAAPPRVTPAIVSGIQALKGGGNPMPQAARKFFEPRFAADLSQVRIHTDANAAETAASINARAFTVGRDIAFATGQYTPDSNAGRHLLAHELTHVIQQNGAASRTIYRDPESAQPVLRDDAGVLSQLTDELETWEGNADQDADLMLRAQASRMVLLLKGWWRTRPVLTTQKDLDEFTGDCQRRSRTELDTLGVFGPAGVELALTFYAKGFPLTWSGRVHAALSLGIDPVALLTAGAEETHKLLLRSIALGPELALNGLPVPYEEIERLSDFRLRVSDATAEKPSSVREYAVEGIRYVQMKWLLSFAFAWESMANQVAEAVADGTRVPSFQDWKDFIDNKQKILRDLPARARDRIAMTEEGIQEIQTDAISLGDAALVLGMASGLLSIFAILGGWNDVTGQFGASLKAADSSVASDGSGDHLLRAAKWAWVNGYFTGAGLAAGKAMLEQLPETLGEMAIFMAIGMIPPLEIPLAIYLYVKLGVDVTKMVVELASAIEEVGNAKTVCDLQKAAARLAAVVAGAVIFGAILAVTFGIGKAVSKLKKSAADIKKGNPALTEEQATKKAMEQLSQSEREALDGTLVRTAKRVAEKFSEFGGVCRIGSILCDGLPASIEKEVGKVPPTKYNVPPPKGSFNIQKAALSTVERDSAFLQKQVLANPGRWPHFDKALKANGGKWPTDSSGRAWQVHHIKQVGMGGASEVDNLFPLPAEDHSILTNYWNQVRYAFQRRFTDAEWNAIYTKSVKNVTATGVPKAPLPK